MRAQTVLEELPRCFGQSIYTFVDTNPALTIYTHVALLAAKKLIVPVRKDEYSASASTELLRRLYGANAIANPPVWLQSAFEFKIRLPEYANREQAPGISNPAHIELPKIDMIIMNQ